MQTFGPILAFVWWIVAGMIGYNMVEPESFFGVLGFLIVWHLVWYAPLIFLGGIGGILHAKARLDARVLEQTLREQQKAAAASEAKAKADAEATLTSNWFKPIRPIEPEASNTKKNSSEPVHYGIEWFRKK